MDISENLIKNWAKIVNESSIDFSGRFGEQIDESSYDDSGMTFDDIKNSISENKERFEKLFGVIDVYVKGSGNDWAIFVELKNRKVRFDSTGEVVDDDLDGEYFEACRESVDTIKDEILGYEAKNNFVSEFAFELDWDGEKITNKQYIDQASATVMKIVPKKNASQDNKRYFAEKSAELYKMAQKIQTSPDADRKTLRKRSNYIWNKYVELEMQYFLWGHDERDFDEFLDDVGGYGKQELMDAIRGNHEGDVDESVTSEKIETKNE